MKKIIAQLGTLGITLTPDASEEAIVAALKQKYETLQGDLDKLKTDFAASTAQAKKEAATMLIEAAVASNKILLTQKESMLKLAESDFVSAKALLDSMPPRVSIAAHLAAAQSTGADTVTFEKLHKENPKELARIKAEEPQRYASLKAVYVERNL